MDKSWMKLLGAVAPILAVVGMVAGWVYHVESGLQRANDVTSLHEQINGVNKDLGYQRGRISNLESLFEPYLIEKRVKEELDKQKKANMAPSPVKARKDAETWVKGQFDRAVEK